MSKLCRYFMLTVAFVMMLVNASHSYAQGLGALTNGSLDPTNKNNNLGFVIRTPGSRTNDSSSLQVQTPRIDEHGYYYDESPNGGRYYDRSKRGTLLRDSRTGKAFWQLGSLTCWAAPQYQQQLDQNERAQREQEMRRQQEIQQRNYQLQQAEAYRRQVEYQQLQQAQRNEMLRRQLQGIVDTIERRPGITGNFHHLASFGEVFQCIVGSFVDWVSNIVDRFNERGIPCCAIYYSS